MTAVATEPRIEMTPARARQIRARLREHPEEFIKRAFGVELYDKQIEIIQSVFHNQRTVVRSGHSVGKTFLSAAVLHAFMQLMDDPIVITTAPTHRQVKELLWREVRGMHAKAADHGMPLGGEIQQMRYEVTPTSFAVGFSTEPGEGGVKFQGWHCPSLLLIFDEAAGVPPEIWEAAEAAMASDGARMLCIGNPVSKATPFYDACMDPAWNRFAISSWDTPNAKTGENVLPGLATRKWCEDMRKKYGETSPIYQFRVLGEFPSEGTDTLIALEWCEAAADRERVAPGVKVGGVDVARYGDDQTVIVGMTGGHIDGTTKLSKCSTMETAGRVADLHKRAGWSLVCVDDTGVGGGVTDRLRELGVPVLAVNFNQTAYDQEHYYNAVTEMFAWLAEDLRAGHISGLPKTDGTIKQLTTRKYSFTSAGKMKVESKDEFKKRFGMSPDEGDALLLANYGRRLGGDISYMTQAFL